MKLSSWCLIVFISLFSGSALGQVATGTPPYGSFGGGPFDILNLGNLNVHFSIPILHKAGRGVPFRYDLTYDSSIWYPTISGGTTQWGPSADWGWTSNSYAVLGRVASFTEQVSQLSGKICPGSQWGVQTVYATTYTYVDPKRASHPFPGSTRKTVITGSCNNTTYGPGFTATATDGAGYNITVTVNQVTGATTFNVVTRSGIIVYNGNGNYTDTNGNQLTVNTSTGQFFDTLSSTAPVLTQAGSGTPTSPVTYKYTPPSGGTATYTINYSQYTVETAFGVSNVKEYGPVNNNLVSNIQLPDGSEYTFTYEAGPSSCSPCVTGRIKTVTSPTGGTITYQYTGGSNGIESDGSTAGLTRTLNPGGEWQYSRTLQTGPIGPGSTWQTKVIDPSGNNSVINFAEDSTVTNTSSNPQTIATYNFYETQRKVYQGNVSSNNCSSTNPSNCLLLTTTACYSTHYSGCSTATVGSPISQTDYYSQPAGGTTRLSETLYNGYGLVTDDKEYDYGVITGSAPGTTKLIRETSTGYASLGNGIVNRPSSVKVYDWSSGSEATLASSTYSYDQGGVTSPPGTPQHISVSGSRGNLTTLTTSTSSTASLSKTFTYYDTGNVNVVTDVNSAQTTYVYGTTAQGNTTVSCGNSFSTTINEPLNLSRSTTWNCTGGVATQVTDENGNNVSADFSTDPDFWRPASTTDQLDNETKLSYSKTTVELTLQNFNGGSSAWDSLATVDGFGRPAFSQRLQAPGGANYDTVETDYNTLGQANRITMPYTATASPNSENTTVAATTKTYDALGRVLTIIDGSGGTVAYSYSINDVLQAVSGSQTFQKQFEYDGLGRLTSVCEITAGTSTWPGGHCAQSTSQTGYWTKYSYNALGNLLTVTQNAQATTGSQQSRSFSYDRLGRMTSESNPESGATNYYWDSAPDCSYPTLGDMLEKKDHAGVIACYWYDNLHRLITITADRSKSGYTCEIFAYDSSSTPYASTPPSGATFTNTAGRLVEAWVNSCNGNSTLVTAEWFNYDKRGQVTDTYELTPNSGGYYHSSAGYWANGVLKTLGLANSSGAAMIPTQSYGLDSEGRTNSVSASSGQNPTTGVTYSPGTSTAPLGYITNVAFGSADSDAFTYDPGTGRLTSYTFSVNSKTDVGTLTWNANGTLQKLVINDQVPSTSDSGTCTYGYDDLQRISNVTCGTFWVQNFGYDPFGNISKTVPQGDGGLSFLPTYFAAPPSNQFSVLPGVSVQYNANGNLLVDNLNTYTWDAYGRMATVTPTGGSTVAATYDALGRMVENNAGGSYTQFVYGPTGKLAKCSGQTLIKALVALPGGAKAVYTPSGLSYYRHSDWLGSSRLTSTATAPTSMYSSSAYAPFGEQYATAGSSDASYTGQDQDTVSNLYDFPNRRHSPSQGRWISPDPSGRASVKLTNPQTWNRYAYVINNPLRLVDPLGLDLEDSNCDPETDDNCDGGGDGGDDGSGDGSGTDGGGCAYDACVTASDPGQNPCVMVVGGIDDSTGDLAAANTMGGEASYPLGQGVVGGFNPLGTGALGVASVAQQGFSGSNASTNQFISDLNNVGSQNNNILLVGFSGGAQTISTGINLLQSTTPQGYLGPQDNVQGIVLVSPGIPGGFTNSIDVPTMVFDGGGAVNGVVGAFNINGTPGTVNQISGCDEHSASCELFGPNGVLNGVQSDCTGQGGDDATGGSPNVGELVDPDKDGNDWLLATKVQQWVL